MSDFTRTATDLFQLGSKIAHLYTRRALDAQHAFFSRTQAAVGEGFAPGKADGAKGGWPAYVTDCAQRWALFWDTMRQRGNNFLAHERAGKPPVLVFDYEMVVDGR